MSFPRDEALWWGARLAGVPFDAFAFEEWLSALPPAPYWANVQHILAAARDGAMQKMRANDWHEFRARLGVLYEVWHGYARELKMEPLARAGKKHSSQQAKRRKDKPGKDPAADPGRNDRLRAYHARLIAQGDRDATSQTAVDFDMSTSNVRRILRGT